MINIITLFNAWDGARVKYNSWKEYDHLALPNVQQSVEKRVRYSQQLAECLLKSRKVKGGGGGMHTPSFK